MTNLAVRPPRRRPHLHWLLAQHPPQRSAIPLARAHLLVLRHHSVPILHPVRRRPNRAPRRVGQYTPPLEQNERRARALEEWTQEAEFIADYDLADAGYVSDDGDAVHDCGYVFTCLERVDAFACSEVVG
jgi:hypothetical protein